MSRSYEETRARDQAADVERRRRKALIRHYNALCGERRFSTFQVGRPAKYNTFGEYAGRVFLRSRAANRPGWRDGAVNVGRNA